MWDEAALADLQKDLGHSFEKIELLQRALTHRSWVEEQNPGGNAPGHLSQQRLEFLGDAILNYAVARWLHRELPQADEGDLTQRRSDFVKGDALDQWGQALAVRDLVRRGRGESAMAGQNKRLVADTVEAVIGAVLVDGGEAAAIALIERWLPEEVPQAAPKDPIVELGEWYQGQHGSSPPGPVSEAQDTTGELGWAVVYEVDGAEVTGRGGTKKEAKRDAFRQLIALLGV